MSFRQTERTAEHIPNPRIQIKIANPIGNRTRATWLEDLRLWTRESFTENFLIESFNFLVINY